MPFGFQRKNENISAIKQPVAAIGFKALCGCYNLYSYINNEYTKQSLIRADFVLEK